MLLSSCYRHRGNNQFNCGLFLSWHCCVFLSSIKYHFGHKRDASVILDTPLVMAPGLSDPVDPSPQILTRHSAAQGCLSFCKTLKSGVCTICVAPLRRDHRKLNQESIVFRDCFSRNNNLVPYVINSPIPRSSLYPFVEPLPLSSSSSVVRKCP